jgi:hypothetical protein
VSGVLCENCLEVVDVDTNSPVIGKMFYFQDVLKLLSARDVCFKIICFQIIFTRFFISHEDVLYFQNMKFMSCETKNIVMLSFSEIFHFT